MTTRIATIVTLAFTVAGGSIATAQDAATPTSIAIPGERVFPEGLAIDAAGERLFTASAESGVVYTGSLDDTALRTFSKAGTVTDARLDGPTAVALDGEDALLVNAQFAAREGRPDLPFTVSRVRLPAAMRP